MTLRRAHPTHDPNGAQPASGAFSITPADADLSYIVRGLYVGTTGDVVVYMEGATTAITFKNVPAGFILPIRAGQVRQATTAADIVGLY